MEEFEIKYSDNNEYVLVYINIYFEYNKNDFLKLNPSDSYN